MLPCIAEGVLFEQTAVNNMLRTEVSSRMFYSFSNMLFSKNSLGKILGLCMYWLFVSKIQWLVRSLTFFFSCITPINLEESLFTTKYVEICHTRISKKPPQSEFQPYESLIWSTFIHTGQLPCSDGCIRTNVDRQIHTPMPEITIGHFLSNFTI